MPAWRQVWDYDPGQRRQGAPRVNLNPKVPSPALHSGPASCHCRPPCAPSSLPTTISEPDHGEARMETRETRGQDLLRPHGSQRGRGLK